MQVNAEREIVHMTCGDHFHYYKDSVAFSREVFRAPFPEDADLVVSNAYPIDLSLTFVLMKGIIPLLSCPPEASRIVVDSCSQGMRYHGLFPFMNLPKFQRLWTRIQSVSVMKPGEIVDRISMRLHNRITSHFGHNVSNPIRRYKFSQKHPIWLYRPGNYGMKLSSRVGDI